MNRRVWILGLIPVMAFLVMIPASAFAAQYTNEPGRVETFGVVSNANLNGGTISITVNKASKGLEDKFGEDVTFHTSNAMRVDTCSIKTHTLSGCWNQLAENAGREAGRTEQKAELRQVKNGDRVFVSGYFDKNSGRFVADEILKWPS
ncbi:MAG: hypothetical protein WAN11_19305 [Syntrophobacteraceae bacterium]